MVVPPRWGARVGYRQYYDPQFPKGAEGLLRTRISSSHPTLPNLKYYQSEATHASYMISAGSAVGALSVYPRDPAPDLVVGLALQ